MPLAYELKRNKGTRSLKISTNKIYAGIHWGQRKTIKDRILDTTERFCRPANRITAYPVQIGYRFVFGTRALDTLNCAYMAKMFEDALRTLEILEDDDPSHVASTIIDVAQLPREKRPKARDGEWAKAHAQNKDYVEISIRPYVQSHFLSAAQISAMRGVTQK